MPTPEEAFGQPEDNRLAGQRVDCFSRCDGFKSHKVKQVYYSHHDIVQSTPSALLFPDCSQYVLDIITIRDARIILRDGEGVLAFGTLSRPTGRRRLPIAYILISPPVWTSSGVKSDLRKCAD